MAQSLNWLDRLIAAISPAAGVARAQNRRALDIMTANYEGAGRGRRFAGRRTPPTSASAETLIGLRLLRDRMRDLVRNNPYAAGAVNALVGNIIGYGITCTPSLVKKNAAQAAILKAAWNGWANSTACDYEGRHTLSGLQRLAMRAIVEGGEVLIRRRFVQGQTIPIQLQLLEGDYLDDNKNGQLESGNICYQGVEYNSVGKRVAYWLYPKHPGDTFFNLTDSYVSSRYPASNIIHVFRADRVGQVRGIPWGAPCVLRMYDFDKYEDAQLLRQQIAACFTAFISNTTLPDEEVKQEDFKIERLQPGTIQALGTGKTIQFSDPPEVSNYSDYSKTVLKAIAKGFGVTYEMISNDGSESNYSSSRLQKIEFWNNLDDWQWNMFIPQFCQQVFGWVAQVLPFADVTAPVTCDFTPPVRRLSDPSREVPAIIQQIRSNLLTPQEAIRQMGYEPDKVLADTASWDKQMDAAGIISDADPRRVTMQGQYQSGNAGADAGEKDTPAP